MLRLPRLVIALPLLAAAAAPLAGQSGQYTPPGALGVHPVDAREALRAAVDEAPWRLGPIRLDPWLGLREIAWVENEGEPGDLTIAVGAGLRAYLPVGSRLVLTAHALPEYVWWRDRADDRRLASRAGAGLFYYANRLGLEVRASASDLDDYATPEVQRRTEVDARTLAARLDVPLGHRLALFVRAERGDFDVVDEDPVVADLENLDRTDTRLEGGVRLLLGHDLWIGVGAGTSESEFDAAALDLSNDGSHSLVEIGWNRPKLDVSYVVRRVELEPVAGSAFGGFDDTTWRGQVSWQPRRQSSLAVYAQSDLVYSVLSDAPYFLDERAGVRVGLPLGSRLALAGFYEDGEHDYSDGRRDDVRSWGGTLDAPIYRRLRLAVAARTTEIEGDLGRREIREVGLRLSLGGSGPSWP